MKKARRSDKKRGGFTKRVRILILRTLPNNTMFERNISRIKEVLA